MFHPMQIGGKRGPKQKVLGLKVGLAHMVSRWASYFNKETLTQVLSDDDTPIQTFLRLRHQWCQTSRSELEGGEEQAKRAAQSRRVLTSTFDITDDVDSKKFALGHSHHLTLLPCYMLNFESHRLACWLGGKRSVCL